MKTELTPDELEQVKIRMRVRYALVHIDTLVTQYGSDDPFWILSKRNQINKEPEQGKEPHPLKDKLQYVERPVIERS